MNDYTQGLIDDFVEKGAVLEHQRWAKWQEYLHSRCKQNSDGSLTIPTASVLHWKRQILTHYDQLTEQEKESDRKETRQYLPLLKKTIHQAEQNMLKRVIETLENEKCKVIDDSCEVNNHTIDRLIILLSDKK